MVVPPFHTPSADHFFVGKPMVVGYHFMKPPGAGLNQPIWKYARGPVKLEKISPEKRGENKKHVTSQYPTVDASEIRRKRTSWYGKVGK